MVARLVYAQPVAGVLAQVLAETLDPVEAAVGLFERADGRWTVEINFRIPPDEARSAISSRLSQAAMRRTT